jgi:hypothetical protein
MNIITNTLIASPFVFINIIINNIKNEKIKNITHIIKGEITTNQGDLIVTSRYTCHRSIHRVRYTLHVHCESTILVEHIESKVF